MSAQDMAEQRPGLLRRDPASNTSGARDERLKTLYAKWDQFVGEYREAQQQGDEELMTNLRGLMLLIKKEIRRLGGQMRDFPYSDEHHLADL
ncbi:MAG: hypothetical protein ACRDJN_25230 [Chloroflexota bacterium]